MKATVYKKGTEFLLYKIYLFPDNYTRNVWVSMENRPDIFELGDPVPTWSMGMSGLSYSKNQSDFITKAIVVANQIVQSEGADISGIEIMTDEEIISEWDRTHPKWNN